MVTASGRVRCRSRARFSREGEPALSGMGEALHRRASRVHCWPLCRPDPRDSREAPRDLSETSRCVVAWLLTARAPELKPAMTVGVRVWALLSRALTAESLPAVVVRQMRHVGVRASKSCLAGWAGTAHLRVTGWARRAWDGEEHHVCRQWPLFRVRSPGPHRAGVVVVGVVLARVCCAFVREQWSALSLDVGH